MSRIVSILRLSNIGLTKVKENISIVGDFNKKREQFT